MPQLPAFTIPDWKRPVTIVTETAQNLATGLAEQGRETTDDVLHRVGDVFGSVLRRLTAPAVEELLAELEEHDERVRDALREELQTFAAAVGDGMFAMAVPDSLGAPTRANGRSDRDYFEDDIDLVDLDNGFDDLDYAAE